jgi:translation initiation factor IF-1
MGFVVHDKVMSEIRMMSSENEAQSGQRAHKRKCRDNETTNAHERGKDRGHTVRLKEKSDPMPSSTRRQLKYTSPYAW